MPPLARNASMRSVWPSTSPTWTGAGAARRAPPNSPCPASPVGVTGVTGVAETRVESAPPLCEPVVFPATRVRSSAMALRRRQELDAHHRHIVGRAAIEGGVDQHLDGDCDRPVAAEQRGDLAVFEHLGRAVAAQQEDVVAAQAIVEHVDGELVMGADGAGHDVRVRMRARLLRRQRAVTDQLLPLAVVAADLVQPVVAQHIEPAVAGPGAGEMLAEDEQRDDGAGAQALATLRRCLLLKLPVDGFELVADLGEEGRGGGGRADAAQRLDDEAAGAVALAGTADAIGHRPKAEIRTLEERILVDLAHLADMSDGGGGEAEAGRRRWLRRDGVPYRVFHPHCSHLPSSSAAKRSTDGQPSAETSDGLKRSEPLVHHSV